MTPEIKIGSILHPKTGGTWYVVYGIVSEQPNEYTPPVGALRALVAGPDGIPTRLNCSKPDGRFFGVTLYPDSLHKYLVVGSVEPELVEKYVLLRTEEAAADVEAEKHQFVVEGRELTERRVKRWGNSAGAALPVSWAGSTVIVIRKD